MPETPETQKEIIEIKKEVREIRQAQDAEFYQNRSIWEDHVYRTIDNNANSMKVLLAIDGTKSANDLEKETGLYQVMCWRILKRLQKDGIIYRLEETKKGSPIYAKSRWYKVLSLDELVQRKLVVASQPEASVEPTQSTLNVTQEDVRNPTPA
jgi:predicted transcriptional regulator